MLDPRHEGRAHTSPPYWSQEFVFVGARSVSCVIVDAVVKMLIDVSENSCCLYMMRIPKKVGELFLLNSNF